jgi:hypothetical protein
MSKYMLVILTAGENTQLKRLRFDVAHHKRALADKFNRGFVLRSQLFL